MAKKYLKPSPNGFGLFSKIGLIQHQFAVFGVGDKPDFHQHSRSIGIPENIKVRCPHLALDRLEGIELLLNCLCQETAICFPILIIHNSTPPPPVFVPVDMDAD